MTPRRSCRKRTLPSRDVSQKPAVKPSKKPRRCKSTGRNNQSNKDPENTSLNIPCNPTLFLSDDNLEFSWEPFKSSKKAESTLLRHFAPHGNDVHSYFTSPQAAKYATLHCDSISIFRHIGHITLHKFQQLEDLPVLHQWFRDVQRSSKMFINLSVAIQSCWSEDRKLVASLRSLAAVQEAPWPKPYIVLLARRDDVVRACDLKRYKDDFDLDVEVYAGRLLFEIIACRDIQHLFSALKSSYPYSPIPKLPECPEYFARSPMPPLGDNNSFARILRDAESTGYAGLTSDHKKKVAKGLTLNLYPYQEQTVRWMLDKENEKYTLNDYFWEERSFTGSSDIPGGKYYYFPLSGEVRLRQPPRTRGGMVTEEMGLGKTVEALALILAQKVETSAVEMNVFCEENPPEVRVVNGVIHLSRLRLKNQERSHRNVCGFHHGDEVIGDPDEIEFPGEVRIRRWPANTTLIVCPRSLIGQWRQEISKCAPSLTLEVWDTVKDKNASTFSLAVGEKAKDIVLTTYDMVRTDSTLSTICWRRVILDEAQVTRRSATQVAKDIFNLRSDVRFLMTGTPLVNSINDLKGQLASLKVWPFALEDDGFWERYVFFPFSLGCEVQPLPYLLKVTMIRHAKAQALSISLPSRIYETIKVRLSGSYRACYQYIWASCFDELESQNLTRIDTRRLRTLLKIILSLCLSPDLLNAVSLDLVRRFTWSRKSHSTPSSVLQKIQTVSFEEAIQFVAECGRGIVRDSNRSFAVQGVSSDLVRFSNMSLTELRKYVVSQNLLEEKRALRIMRERLIALAAGGVHRLATDSTAEMRQTAVNLGIGSKEDVDTWSRSKVKARLTMHYNLKNGYQIARTVHESGFAALMKLMEGKGNPSCPVCLADCDGRVTVTKCGHMYCLECMQMLLTGSTVCRRCAICRRDISSDLAVEIKRNVSETEGATSVSSIGVGRTTQMSQVSPSHRDNESGESARGNTGNRSITESRREIGMTAQEAWCQFELCGPAPAEVGALGRNEHYPSLNGQFIRHWAAIRNGEATAPKLTALFNLISSSPEDVKFCVVAGSVKSLQVIAKFLTGEGIECVGAGAPIPQTARRGGINKVLSEAAERFRTDAAVRVYLLNPSNSAGLTLTAASVVVFMETLERVADEIQASSRVHRIGQRRNVRIVRIVAEDTVEETMVERRGEITSAEEESHALASATSNEASDGQILQLFGRL